MRNLGYYEPYWFALILIGFCMSYIYMNGEEKTSLCVADEMLTK